jgi:lipoprotein-anchoring transpeptidase ErfK/SrfK
LKRGAQAWKRLALQVALDSQSHGCLRLTNWDTMRLAALVDRGTRMVLQ